MKLFSLYLLMLACVLFGWAAAELLAHTNLLAPLAFVMAGVNAVVQYVRYTVDCELHVERVTKGLSR
jgi:hypothetical protein